MHIKPSHIKSITPYILLAITILLQFILKHNPVITEKIYSNGLYPLIAAVLSNISAIVPFSLDDIFYILLVTGFIVGTLLTIFRQIALRTYLLRTTQVIAIVYISFYWLWGFNYYRQPAQERLHLVKTSPNDSTFTKAFDYIIHKANISYTSETNFDINLYETAQETSYKDMSGFLHTNHSMIKPRIKNITFSNFFAKATILGYYGPFFNETHINKHLTCWDIPVVSAHEKSHQQGVTSEAEASFYGWLISINSQDQFSQYAGWLYALDYFIYQSRDLSQRKELLKKIKPEVITDIRAQNKHWRNWRNVKIDKAATRVNDAYLKSNNVEKGIEDYNGVVQLIIDYLVSEKSL